MELQEAVSELRRAFAEASPKLDPIDDPSGRGRRVVAVREGYNLEYLMGPERGRRLHRIHDITSFADWLNRHADPDRTEVLVDVHEVTAHLEPADPEGDMVVCQLSLHPLFQAWEAVFGKVLNQKLFHYQVRVLFDTFDAINNENTELTYGSLLMGSLGSLKVSSTGTLKTELDTTGMIKVLASDQGRSVDKQLPPEFSVTVPIIDGVLDGGLDAASHGELKTYRLGLLLEVEAGESGLAFTVNCPQLAVALRDARRDAAEFLTGLLKDDFLVGLGAARVESVADVNAG